MSPSPTLTFPALDVVGADNAVPADAVVASVQRLGVGLLAPAAEAADIDGVPRSHFDALANVGALGRAHAAPVQRELAELIAGSCGTTWFCWAQHRTPTEIIANSDNDELREQWADDLYRGRALAGVAFAHVRRPGAPAVSATANSDGWNFSGSLDWVTSWTIADVVVVVAETVDGQLVQAVLEPGVQPGVTVTGPLPLAAMNGTHTWPVRLDDLHVPAASVAKVEPKAEWLARDALTTVNVSPHIFGVSRAAIALLAATGEQRKQPAAVELAEQFADHLRTMRRTAYALIDDEPANEFTAERLALRADALDLAVRTTTAAVAARAGGAMRLSDPAQRYAREALFYLVQAQTADGRAATLRRWTQG